MITVKHRQSLGIGNMPCSTSGQVIRVSSESIPVYTSFLYRAVLVMDSQMSNIKAGRDSEGIRTTGQDAVHCSSFSTISTMQYTMVSLEQTAE